MFSQYEADIIEKGISIYWTTLGSARGLSLHTGDICYLKSNGNNGPERIFDIKIDNKNVEERISQMIANIKAGTMPDSLLITPNTMPSNLENILAEQGFNIDRSGVCMLMDLDSYKHIDKANDSIAIKKVVDSEDLKIWSAIVNTALFEYELFSFEQFHDIFDLENTQFYLGYYDAIPVTACMTIFQDDTSVLEMVATLKEYRKRGIATAAIDMALCDLKDLKIKTVSLRAEPDGISVYKKLGFKECFERIVADCTI